MAKRYTPFGTTTYIDPYEQAAMDAARYNASAQSSENQWRGNNQWQDTRQAAAMQAAAMQAQAMAQAEQARAQAMMQSEQAKSQAMREIEMSRIDASKYGVDKQLQGQQATQAARMKELEYGNSVENSRYERGQAAKGKNAIRDVLLSRMNDPNTPENIKLEIAKALSSGDVSGMFAGGAADEYSGEAPNIWADRPEVKLVKDRDKFASAVTEPTIERNIKELIELVKTKPATILGKRNADVIKRMVSDLANQISAQSGANGIDPVSARAMLEQLIAPHAYSEDPSVPGVLGFLSPAGVVGGNLGMDFSRYIAEGIGVYPTKEDFLKETFGR